MIQLEARDGTWLIRANFQHHEKPESRAEHIENILTNLLIRLHDETRTQEHRKPCGFSGAPAYWEWTISAI